MMAMKPIFILLCSFFIIIVHSFAVEVNIRDLGAVNDGQTLNTSVIQAAIDSCARAGGGEVRIPAGGVYLTGTIYLKTNVLLHIENGATLQGSPRIADYDTSFPHLIIADHITNTGIIGQGIVDGNGAAFWDENFVPRERPSPWLRFFDCQQLRFTDVQLLNSPAHVLDLTHCDGVIINGIRIVNHLQSPNTDGIDIRDTRNVLITNCYIETGDDAICLKSHDTWVESIIATHNIIISDDAAIKLGTGGHVGTRYCTFANNIIRNTRYGIALFQMDGGRYEHCLFTDMIIHTASRYRTEYPIFMDIDKRQEKGKLGSIEHIQFSNIQIISRGNCLIAGQKKAPLQNIHFDNITFIADENPADLSSVRKPRGNKTLSYHADMQDFAQQNAWFTFACIEGLSLRNITIDQNGKKRKIFYFNEVTKLNNKKKFFTR
jgi:hypothetical protein